VERLSSSHHDRYALGQPAVIKIILPKNAIAQVLDVLIFVEVYQQAGSAHRADSTSTGMIVVWAL